MNPMYQWRRKKKGQQEKREQREHPNRQSLKMIGTQESLADLMKEINKRDKPVNLIEDLSGTP